MQKVKIPQKVDPYRSATKRLDYDGIISKENFSRLAEVVEAILKDIEVHISFNVDLQGLTAIAGRASTAVKCVCQRCGESFDLDLVAEFSYTPDQKKIESMGLTTEYDFVSTDEFGEIDLYSLVEDELILALPIIPKHQEDDCAESEEKWVYGHVVESEKANPFAVLNELKSKKS
jgi:uncharacterized protein